VLEVMRQPLEDRSITISRSKFSIDYPASFMLVASMNPCPCGFYNHPEKDCVCGTGVVQKYLNKVSGPLLDRIDIHIEVTPVSFNELSGHRMGESSAVVRERVISARERQQVRYRNVSGMSCNAQMDSRLLREHCALSESGTRMLSTAMEKLKLSARAYDRILKVARTIADLAGSEHIGSEHLAEAIQYRSLDRENWAG
jgi:magnesium chelatase family protein